MVVVCIATLSSRVDISLDNVVMDTCTIVWTFFGWIRCCYNRYVVIVVVFSMIPHLQIVFSCTLSTSSSIIIFFPSSSSWGSRYNLTNSCVSLFMHE
jgi:hypothetical protein